MKRTRKQLVWKETGGSLVRGHTRYEANAGQGKYEISPYSELQRNGSEPKFGGYSIRRYPTKTSTIKDARTLKSSAKTADEARRWRSAITSGARHDRRRQRARPQGQH